MPSKLVNVNTAEVSRNGFKGIFDLQVGRNMAPDRGNRFLGFLADVPIGATVTVPNPPTIFTIGQGILSGNDAYTGRNIEARPDAHRMMVGSGISLSEYKTSFYGGDFSRTHQGEISLATGATRPSGWPVPLP